MFILTLLILLASFKIVYNDNGDGWEGDKVIWTKFNLIPKPVLSNFTKSFHSVLKNSGFTTKAPKPVISVKLNQTKDIDVQGLRNVSNERERKVPMDSITLSSKIVGFPEDRTVPTKVVPVPLPTTTPVADALARRRRRPVIKYEEVEEEEDEDDDDEDDITDQFDVEDDDDDDEEEEEVEVVEEVPEPVDKHEYEDATYVEPVAIKKTKRVRKKSKKYLKLKDFKKLRKFMLPLLLAYKLKFFTLIPLLLGGLVLIVGTTGFAGFFFALFAVGLGLQKNNHG